MSHDDPQNPLSAPPQPGDVRTQFHGALQRAQFFGVHMVVTQAEANDLTTFVRSTDAWADLCAAEDEIEVSKAVMAACETGPDDLRAALSRRREAENRVRLVALGWFRDLVSANAPIRGREALPKGDDEAAESEDLGEGVEAARSGG